LELVLLFKRYMTKEYQILIEMTDGGKLLTSDKKDDFIYKYLVRTEVMKTRELIAGLICFAHHNFPVVDDIITTIYYKGEPREAIVIRVTCCCEKFLNIIETRFHAK
jgi:hypothetical protein